MAIRTTDPKDFARHINVEMLVEFLKKQNPSVKFIPTEDKEFKLNKKQRVSEENIEEFIDLVQSLPQQTEYIFNEILYINHLSSERHTQTMFVLAQEKGENIDIKTYQTCQNEDERALWWYMHHKNIFDEYFQKADTENIAGLKEFKIKDPLAVSNKTIIEKTKLDKFGQEIFRIYENSFRGKKFKVSTFERNGDVLIRIYLENLPSSELVFTNSGSEIERTPTIRSLFSILVTYSEKEKTLGIRAESPKENVPKIKELFCKIFLDCDAKDLEEFAFNIKDKVEKIDIALTPLLDDGIERVFLKVVEYSIFGDGGGTIRLDVGSKKEFSGTEPMEKLIKRLGINEEYLKAKRYELQFEFTNEFSEAGRKRKITTHITPKSYGLRNTKEDARIKKFLREKGFIS